MYLMRWFVVCATALFIFSPAVGQAQTDWEYTGLSAIQCREGAASGIAVRRAPVQSKRMVIFMQGGGACFDQETCDNNPKSFTPDDLTKLRGKQLNSGIFYRGAPDNAFADYHQAFIPYCSGDMHAGDMKKGDAPKTVAGVATSQVFAGAANALIYFNEIVRQFSYELSQPGAELMLIGQSAGGWGAMFNASRLQAMIPSTVRFILVDESGPMVDTSISSCVLDEVKTLYGFSNTFLKACPSCRANNWLVDWQQYMLSTFPKMTQAYMGSTEDYIISALLQKKTAKCTQDSGYSFAAYADQLRGMRSRMLSAQLSYGTPTATYIESEWDIKAFHIFTDQLWYYGTPFHQTSAVNFWGRTVRLRDWLSGLYGRTPGLGDQVGLY
jgi:hypothetical protein